MKKVEKKKKKDIGSPETRSKGKVEEVKPKSEKPFDFGGMPDRDFKKNLGCG